MARKNWKESLNLWLAVFYGVAFWLSGSPNVFAATGDIDTVSGSAWTNGSITHPFTGIETDIYLGGNGDIPASPAIEVANSQAMNGYGPGDYIFTKVPYLLGNGVNRDYAHSVLSQFGFTILDQTTDQSNYGYYAGSDVYVLSGYDDAPNPYRNPYYYAPGQYVHLIPIPRPSIQISGARDQTTGRSGRYGVAPGDVLSVKDTYNTADDAPPQWGHKGALLAYFYFHGVYTNAFADSRFDVPEYGFGPYQGNYQPGSVPVTSLSLTVPKTAFGSGELILYYVDGIDRFAEATMPVQVANVCPTMTFMGNQSAGVQIASTATTTVSLQLSGARPLDPIDWTVSGGTFSNGATHRISKLSAKGLLSVQVIQGPGEPRATVTAVDRFFPACPPVTEIIEWPTPPKITLSANPVHLYTGEPSTLDVQAVHLESGERVVIKQTNGAHGTLIGNGQRARTQLNDLLSQAYLQYHVAATATDASAQTLYFMAQVQSASGQPLASASPVAVTWWPRPTLTLSITPTTSQTVGEPFTLTAHATQLHLHDVITIAEVRATYPGTLQGSTKENLQFPWQATSYDFRAVATSFKAQTVIYKAQMRDTETGVTLAVSPEVSATWTPPRAIRPPILTLTAPDTQIRVGKFALLTATSTDLPSAYGLYVHDVSGDHTLEGHNVAGPGGTTTDPTWSTQATDCKAQTVTYQAAQTWLNPSTDALQVIHSNRVQITWQAPMVPRVTLTTSASVEPVDTADTLTAIGSNLPADASIVLIDVHGHTLSTPPKSPPATGGYDWLGLAISAVPMKDTFEAKIVSAQGQVLAQSDQVAITWIAQAPAGGIEKPGDLLLRASALSEPVGQSDTLMASTRYAVGANKEIFLYDVSGDQTLYGQNVRKGSPGATLLQASATDLVAQTVTYQAALQLADGKYVHSNAVTVSWLPIKSGTTPAAGASSGKTQVGTTTCPPPIEPAPQPSARLDSVTWRTTASGAREVTWKDSHYRLMSTVSSEANGCQVISYRWIDQPVTYTHVYPQQLTDFQVTSLYADPGSPDDPWSPSNPFASQQNRDAFTDGSAIVGRGEWPTFGNPDRSPIVYLRVGGAFGFRLQWIGSPDDQVLRARVSFTLRNADGSTRTWMKAMNLLPATTENQGTTVDVAAGANGYPAFASEFVGGFTRIPKYATVPTMQPIQWNLTGDSASAATLQATVYVQTDFATITWTNHDLAQAFGYPVWYFNHQID